MIIGVLLTMRGAFSLGMILLFQGFLSSFMAPVEMIITAGQHLQVMRTEMERVEDVMKYPAAALRWWVRRAAENRRSPN